MDVFKTNKKIKINNFYLDNTKQIPMDNTLVGRISSSTNESNPGANDSNRNIYHVQAREKRRIRNKNVSASTSNAKMSKKSMLENPPSHLNVRTPLSNISNVMDISNNSFRSSLPDVRSNSNGVVHRNKNVSTSTSSVYMSTQPMLQTPPSQLNVRTPLSNISNVIDISNNSFHTPLPNRRLDSNDKFKGVVHQNNNVYASKSSADMSKQSMLQTPTSLLNVRTPLSNISNSMDISNNSFQSPLPNITQYAVFSNGDTSNKSSTITSRSSSVMLPNLNHKNLINTTTIAKIIKIYTKVYQKIILIMVIRLSYAKHVLQNYGKMKLPDNENYSLCCAYGKVELPELKNAPPSYENLFRSGDSKSKQFMKNIRSYNSMFSFTSMGGKIDSSINKGNVPYIFRLSGQNYHSIRSLLPEQGFKPKFSQLYIYDTDNEIANRRTCFGGENQRSTSNSSVLDNDIIQDLKLMLDSNNVLVQSYRMNIGRRDQDGRTYNLPSASEVAALIVGDIGDLIDNRDIVVQTSSGSLRRISELHPSYIPLQYPLLFPYGDDGYMVDIPHRGITPSSNSKRPNCTMREFFSYRIPDRDQYFSLILNSKRLFQQFLVDAYTMIESERLHFIRSKQQILRCESYENLHNQQNLGNKDISNVRQRVILPSSFTGGACYMMQNYLAAMSLCKWFGYPDFFITFTCNPKWLEVKRFLHNTSLHPEDRPDILCRLFKIKLDAFIKDIRENKIFGIIQAVVYTIEFQKRGLPHSHICLFMHADSKRPTVEYVDPIISAEIPNINEDPELYSLVSEFMIHGPCGAENMNCPCMVDKQCSKNFPKQLCNHSSVDVNGYPLYVTP
uniref:Helitron helicase-like domain-containing protein n=1 Tax=Lactuca sativa TaxID=4236 RepID=A0A9R1XMQ7_LACSA|nr:hypothetical protein LSAT_V11C300153220 [Lactuca sativa]